MEHDHRKIAGKHTHPLRPTFKTRILRNRDGANAVQDGSAEEYVWGASPACTGRVSRSLAFVSRSFAFGAKGIYRNGLRGARVGTVLWYRSVVDSKTRGPVVVVEQANGLLNARSVLKSAGHVATTLTECYPSLRLVSARVSLPPSSVQPYSTMSSDQHPSIHHTSAKSLLTGADLSDRLGHVAGGIEAVGRFSNELRLLAHFRYPASVVRDRTFPRRHESGKIKNTASVHYMTENGWLSKAPSAACVAKRQTLPGKIVLHASRLSSAGE